MMKLFVLFFVALTAVLAKETPLTFGFNQTDGVSEPQPFEIPFEYDGLVNITIDFAPADMWFCIHWIVPVVAPYGEDLDLGDIWRSTCTNYQPIQGGSEFNVSRIVLRSGNYFATAALTAEDLDSTGIVDTTQFDFTATISYNECPDNHFGPVCTDTFEPLLFGDNTNVALGASPKYFDLWTVNDDDPSDGRFASSLSFTFVHDSTENVEFTLAQRLMGSPDQLNDGNCERSAAACSISNPPFIATPGYRWGISIDATVDVDANITVKYNYCSEGIGKSCEAYETLPSDLAVGEVKKYSKETTLVFPSSVSVAVGGLDGYTQEDIAPVVLAQIDAQPSTGDSDHFNVLISEGAKANVAIIDMSASPDTQIVLTITPDKSFGIWMVDDNTQCPNNCENHGSCSSLEYVCMCNDKYENLDCSHEIKDFTIEYIILIAVGSLLILSIVVGVPIYCFLNRNQEYETVA